MSDLRLDVLPGPPADAGFVHGRALRDLLRPDFVAAYLDRLRPAVGFDPDELPAQTRRWLRRLPVHHQEEIDGMAMGAGVSTDLVATFLYADIARPPAAPVDPVARRIIAGGDEDDVEEARRSGGPMCSGVIARLDDGDAWIARNCDWLTPTLMRGTAAVVHEAPNRIPVMAVGIRGDIDLDTGVNAEQLWLHLHTLQTRDDPPPDRTCISWLFWAREALETCATLDELERFIERTGRDRGVFAVAGDGKTNEAAIFECSRSAHRRHDIDPAAPACVTNHSLEKQIDARERGPSRRGGTIGRFRALRSRLGETPPRRGPDDLMALLAAPDVEMRTPRFLRTIYSAVANPSATQVWFAAGRDDGTPAASAGRWSVVTPPWVRRARLR